MSIRLSILVFVSGVILLQWQAELPAMSVTPALLLPLLVAIFCWHSQKPVLLLISRSLLLFFVFYCGYFWAAGVATWRLADVLPEVWEGKDIKVIGVISNMPQYDSNKVRFQFNVEQIVTSQAYVPNHVALSWYFDRPSIPAIRAGERWQITIRLKRPHSNINPAGFDYEVWALERNIRAVGYVRPVSDNNRLDSQVNSFVHWVTAQRQQIQQKFNVWLGDYPYVGMLMTLATGDQRAIPADQWQVLTRTGTNHLMAISGLHITLISSIVYFLVTYIWRRSTRLLIKLPAHRAAVIAGLFVALIYTLLSGFAIPAQRAFFMLAVVAIALWYGRMAAPTLILAWALLLVVLIDPWAVLSAGFWLSFGAVGIVMLVTVGRIGNMHWLSGWFHVQWAITLGLVPILLALFQQVSLVSPVANAVAIPLVSLLVVPLTLLALIPYCEFLLPLAHSVLSVAMEFLQVLNTLPQPVWQQHMPPFWAIIVSVIGVVWMLLPGSHGLNYFSGFPARWLGIVALLPLFLTIPPKPSEGALWLTVLDVGQGLAIVAQTENHALLFDSGPAYAETDSGKRIIIPFLRAQGIAQLDRMIISHADSDHSGGALSVINAFNVEMLSSSLDSNHPILQTVKHHELCGRGQSWLWDGVLFEILHPTTDLYLNSNRQTNTSSCVLKITAATGSILIPADITQTIEDLLMDTQAEKLPSTVLIAPHHGSLTSSSVLFVKQVNPAVTIFTVGYRNRFGHPKDTIIHRYLDQGSAVMRSDKHGAIFLRFETGELFVDSWRQMRSRYWHKKAI